MKVLNLLTSGNAGGIESLCRDIGVNSQFENGFCFLFEGGTIYEDMKKIGLKTYLLKDEGGCISLKKYRKLKEIAKEYDIIAVHHGDPFLKLYHYLLSKNLKNKYVTFVHSCYEEKFFCPNNKIKKMAMHKMFQLGLSNSDKIIFVSNAGKNSYMNEFKIDSNKAVVVYNGIGLDKIENGIKKQKIETNPYNITYIGRLNSVKGVDLLLRATKILKEKHNIKISIVGDGEERKTLENLADTLKIDDIVSFYGQQKDVAPFLDKASIFVYPSIWQEVFGISIVEAMAYGIPCVATDVGGIPEIIEDGSNGFLCEKSNSNNLASTIEKVINLIEAGQEYAISNKARKRAEEFSIEQTVMNLKNVYESII